MPSTRRAGLLLIVFAAGLGSGCATPRLTTRFVPAAYLQYDKDQFPNDEAVILYRARRHAMLVSEAGNVSSETLRHEVVAIQKEKALPMALVRLLAGKDDRISGFIARVISPSGKERLVSEASIFESPVPGLGSIKSFRFPAVEVGSVLEVAYVVQSDSFDPTGTFVAWDSHPLLRFEAELFGSLPLQVVSKSYNAEEEIASDRVDDLWRMRWSIEPTKFKPPEPLEPHPSFWAPWWTYRLQKVLLPEGGSLTLFDTWDDVAKGLSQYLFLSSHFEGEHELPDPTSHCQNPVCTVNQTFGWLRAVVPTGVDGVFGRTRTAEELLDAREASWFERAALLAVQLKKKGLTSYLAGVTLPNSRTFDDDFPSFDQFNHALVYVPKQRGLPKDVWLDPSCETCEPGEVTPAVNRGRALIFRSSFGSVASRPRHEVRWVTVAARPGPASATRVTHRAKLDTDGTVHDQLTIEKRGEAGRAYERRMRELSPNRLLKLAREESAISLAQSTQSTPVQCRGKSCSHDRALVIPNHSTTDGTRTFVPLTLLLYQGFELPLKRARRDRDIVFEEGRSYDEELVLELPAGLAAVELPEPTTRAVEGALEVTTEVTAGPGTLTVKRHIAVLAGHFDRALNAELRQLFEHFEGMRYLTVMLEPR